MKQMFFLQETHSYHQDQDQNQDLQKTALNDKSHNPFGFDFESGTNLFFFLVFELGLVPTQIFYRCRFWIW